MLKAKEPNIYSTANIGIIINIQYIFSLPRKFYVITNFIMDDTGSTVYHNVLCYAILHALGKIVGWNNLVKTKSRSTTFLKV